MHYRLVEAGLIAGLAVLALAAAGLASQFRPSVEPAPAAEPAALAPTAEFATCLVLPHVAAAIKPGVPLAEAQRAIELLLEEAGGGSARFQPFAGRWGSDADRGEPVTLTYSFPPDGLTIDTSLGSGFEANPNVLHQRLDQLFGSETIWKQYFRDMFDDWTEITGNTYTEVADDGAAWGQPGPFNGGSGRGDIRIAMGPVTPTQFFAFNFFPENGDMVIDSDWPWGRFGGELPEWRNMLAHEHGHGLGLFHSCPQDDTKLMEPNINTEFLGPQFDDQLSAQWLYGDRTEPNQNTGTAVDLDALGLTNTGSPLLIENLSLHSPSDFDLLRFEASTGAALNVQVRPVGPSYLEGEQTPDCDTGELFDAQTIGDVALDVLRPNLTVAASAADVGPGLSETIADFTTDADGAWFIRIRATSSFGEAQMYDLTVSLQGGAPANPADFSGDGCVDATDLAVLIGAWGAPSADLDGDGTTGASDLAQLIGAWTGTGC